MPNCRCWCWWGWWCPRHPWPPPWAMPYWAPPRPHDPEEELKMLEDMKKDLEYEIKRLEARIQELKEAIEKRRQT